MCISRLVANIAEPMDCPTRFYSKSDLHRRIGPIPTRLNDAGHQLSVGRFNLNTFTLGVSRLFAARGLLKASGSTGAKSPTREFSHCHGPDHPPQLQIQSRIKGSRVIQHDRDFPKSLPRILHDKC